LTYFPAIALRLISLSLWTVQVSSYSRCGPHRRSAPTARQSARLSAAAHRRADASSSVRSCCLCCRTARQARTTKPYYARHLS